MRGRILRPGQPRTRPPGPSAMDAPAASVHLYSVAWPPGTGRDSSGNALDSNEAPAAVLGSVLASQYLAPRESAGAHRDVLRARRSEGTNAGPMA